MPRRKKDQNYAQKKTDNANDTTYVAHPRVSPPRKFLSVTIALEEMQLRADCYRESLKRPLAFQLRHILKPPQRQQREIILKLIGTMEPLDLLH